MLKENKGVTLVALVITIIVLLILAGVSISLVVGDNGVLSNATDAVDETNQAYAQQELEMAISSVQADFYAKYVDETSLTYSEYCTFAALLEYMGDDYTLGTGISSSVITAATASSTSSAVGTYDVDSDHQTENVYVEYKGVIYSFCVEATKSDTGATCYFVAAYDA